MERRTRPTGLFLWLLICVVLLSGRAFAVQGTLIADAHVNVALPGVNSGAISNVNVGNGFTGLLQFDLSNLPAGTTAAQISKATLVLYVNRVDTPGLVSLQPLQSAWSEYGVTYQTLPVLAGATQVFAVSSAGAYIAVDVTGLVQSWVTSPTKNFGCALSAGTAAAQFDSKENDLTGHAAVLDIGIVSQGPAGPVGPAGAVGPAGPVGLAGIAGIPGAPGVAGPAGPQGAAGVAGPIGPVGPAGAAGARGPQGAAGFPYQGTYAPFTSYGMNDMVVFNGSSYVSLTAANHGNPPDQSPRDWGLLAVGGVAGAPGLPGLVYQGAYSSTANYSLGDVVSFQGSSYASLTAANHGNAPGFSPQQWGLLAANGSPGPVGATGAAGSPGPQGPLGPTGPPGERGDQGQQGIAGQAGAQGIAGVAGAQGLGGPAGPQGPAGPVGLAFKGAYQSTANYAQGDGVIFNGSGYVSLSESNHGNTPDQSPAAWVEFASGGKDGPQGMPGLSYQGVYSSAENYGLGDVVFWQGSSYASLSAANHGNTPAVSPQQWGVLAQQGVQGANGAGGPAGPAGPSGVQGPTGPPGERGDQGQQGIAGQAGAQGIPGTAGPQGLSGPAGPQGPAGPVGLSFQGQYAANTNYALGAGISFNGSGYVSLTAGNHGNTPDQSPAAWALFAAAGAPGVAGASGAAGATGAPGPQGPSGPAGLPGAAGPQGVQGPAALTYTGNYSPATSYRVADAVSYGGSTYVSLVDGNHGQTPGESVSFWAVLAAEGKAGAIGAQGPAGVPGPVGATGANGNVGAQGPPVAFRGGWSNTVAYAVGDAASYGGASFIAVAPNFGRQPDLSPAYWSLLAQAGAQGLQGPAGATGAQGPTGYPGPSGPAGAVGATGVQGVQGPAGTPGAIGPAGPAGPAGANGPAGLVYRGAYSNALVYAANDAVTFGGASYLSLTAGNRGNTPGDATPYWAVLAAQGSAGASGPQGAQGPAGAAGIQGPMGAAGTNGMQGPAGPPGAAGPVGASGAAGPIGPAGQNGLTFRGVFNSQTTYGLNDGVTLNGTTYLSLTAGNLGNAPANSPSSWAVSAAGGSTGPAGAPGPAGPAGQSGPAGAAGPPGVAGPAGAVGISFRAAWSLSTVYAVSDAVTYDGSLYLATAANQGAEPDHSANVWSLLAAQGATGPGGSSGQAATIQVGTVSTGAAGSAATVINTGTSNAAVLDFTIPQGAAATGTSGGSGTSGGGSTSGIPFVAMFHAVSYAATFYSLTNTNQAASETTAVLSWVPNGCTASTLNVFSLQNAMITVTLRTGSSPTSLANSSLSCQVSTRQSCTASGSVSVPSGGFADLTITHSDSNPTAVWAAVSCN